MDAPTWNRKALLGAFEKSASPWLATLVFLLDLLLFALGVALAVFAGGVAAKLAGSALATAATVRLFLIGHDACHGSYFASTRLNALVGRIAFLPSLTAFSLWDFGHNTAHHGFNNLKGRDQVWAPYSKQEFDALPRHRQWRERLYRSGLGWGAYYLYEMWWKKLFFASRRAIGTSKRRFTLDSLLVAGAGLLWIAGVAYAARATDQSLVLVLALAVLLPFLLWNGIMGFVVYLHHTNPAIAWFRNRQEWQRQRAYLSSTACVRLPFGIDRLMHSIMEHTAHHLNPRIPMFRLRAAQAFLRERFPEICEFRMNRRSYRDCVRRCKLYDYATHAWLDFDGRVTARVSLASVAA